MLFPDFQNENENEKNTTRMRFGNQMVGIFPVWNLKRKNKDEKH